MINPMSKVTLLCMEKDADSTLKALRKLGILHVSIRQGGTAAGKSASSDAAAKIAAAMSAKAAVQRVIDEGADDAHAKRIVPATAQDAIDSITALDGKVKALKAEVAALEEEALAQSPFGDFDPKSVAHLEGKGVKVTLFRVAGKNAKAPAGENVKMLADAGKAKYGVAFGEFKAGREGVQVLGMPRYSLSEITGMVAERQAALRESREELAAICSEATGKLIDARIADLQDELSYDKVLESFNEHGDVIDLEGFCPTECEARLAAASKANGWAYWLRKPDAEDVPPVDLKIPRVFRPVLCLFKGLGILPGYLEADVSAVFLAFFSIFFAMIIGDAGYGTLMLIAVLFLRFKKPKAPAQPFWLFGLLAACTMVWGALSGNFFSIPAAHLPRFMRGVPWLASDPARNDHVMWLCFVIGAVQITIAHAWNAIALFPRRKAFAQIGWICVVWLMFFIAGKLVAPSIVTSIPPFITYVGVIGILLIVLFMTDPKDFKEEWINHPMLILNLTSCLVDVISYVRLFAVGMASAQIAMIFNELAIGLSMPSYAKWFFTALILVLGHGLNIVLGALSILVHAVRLNTLEFSNHKGITWSGQPYEPFSEARKQ